MWPTTWKECVDSEFHPMRHNSLQYDLKDAFRRGNIDLPFVWFYQIFLELPTNLTLYLEIPDSLLNKNDTPLHCTVQWSLFLFHGRRGVVSCIFF